MEKQKKKATRNELERRMNNAVVLVPRDKDYKCVYFDDRGLRLEITSDYCVIGTLFHRHIFSAITANGKSRPYLYTERIIDMALNNDCKVKDKKGGVLYSFTKLMEVLDKKEDKTDSNTLYYFDMWITNCFAPLFSISERTDDIFLVCESYIHNVARTEVVKSDKKEDMTNMAFVDATLAKEKELAQVWDEHVIFPKLSEEEKKMQDAEAFNEYLQEKAISETTEEQEKAMEAQVNGASEI